jgi:hypothetical protein
VVLPFGTSSTINSPLTRDVVSDVDWDQYNRHLRPTHWPHSSAPLELNQPSRHGSLLLERLTSRVCSSWTLSTLFACCLVHFLVTSFLSLFACCLVPFCCTEVDPRESFSLAWWSMLVVGLIRACLLFACCLGRYQSVQVVPWLLCCFVDCYWLLEGVVLHLIDPWPGAGCYCPFFRLLSCLGTVVPIDTSEARHELMLAICVVAHLFPYSDAGNKVLIWLCWVTPKCFPVIMLSLHLLFSAGLCLFWGCEVLSRFCHVVSLSDLCCELLCGAWPLGLFAYLLSWPTSISLSMNYISIRA